MAEAWFLLSGVSGFAGRSGPWEFYFSKDHTCCISISFSVHFGIALRWSFCFRNGHWAWYGAWDWVQHGAWSAEHSARYYFALEATVFRYTTHDSDENDLHAVITESKEEFHKGGRKRPLWHYRVLCIGYNEKCKK